MNNTLINRGATAIFCVGLFLGNCGVTLAETNPDWFTLPSLDGVTPGSIPEPVSDSSTWFTLPSLDGVYPGSIPEGNSGGSGSGLTGGTSSGSGNSGSDLSTGSGGTGSSESGSSDTGGTGTGSGGTETGSGSGGSGSNTDTGMGMSDGGSETDSGTGSSNGSGTGTGSGSGSTGASTPGAGTTGGTSSGSSSDSPDHIVGPVGSTSLPSSGTVVYVSTTGSDENGLGTFALPYRTISKALDVVDSNASIVLRGGRYVEGGEVRIRKPNITIQSYSGERAIIDGSNLTNEDSAVNIDVGADGTKLLGLEIIGGFYAVETQTTWDWGGDSDRSGVSNILIENNYIHGSGRDAIKIKPNVNKVSVLHNEIYDTGNYQSAEECNAEGLDAVNGYDLLIKNNYFHDICSTGLYCKGGTERCVVENNVIMNAGNAGIIVGFDSSPEYFDLSRNPDYYENIDGVVRNNLIVNTKWEGIGLYGSKNALIENNTVVNAASVYHNPLYFGVTFQDWDPVAKRPGNINPTVRNNIFVNAVGAPSEIVGIRYSTELGGLTGLNGSAFLEGNCYYSADGKAATFIDNRPGQILYDVILSTWLTRFNFDKLSVEGNPFFDNKYLPSTNSVCAGKGYKG